MSIREQITELRRTRADMLGTDDEEHYWACHRAAGTMEKMLVVVDAADEYVGLWHNVERSRLSGLKEALAAVTARDDSEQTGIVQKITAGRLMDMDDKRMEQYQRPRCGDCGADIDNCSDICPECGSAEKALAAVTARDDSEQTGADVVDCSRAGIDKPTDKRPFGLDPEHFEGRN